MPFTQLNPDGTARLGKDAALWYAETVADLKAFDPPITNGICLAVTIGFITPFDKGGMMYAFNENDTSAEALPMIVMPNSAPASGRWNVLLCCDYYYYYRNGNEN
jgi:hypothetical protein